MIHSLRLLAGALLLCCFTLSANAQCVPDSTIPSLPGIYPNPLPPATGCQWYDESITFRLPEDTTVSVSGVPFTVPFVSFTVDSILGLPDGISWECNLAPDCRYVIDPDSAVQNPIGCIRLYGTPTVPAIYAVQVKLTARALVFGNLIDNPGELYSSLTVDPCSYTGACYTLSLSSSCAPVTISMDNEIPSNGEAGFSYDWEITGPNGYQFSSNLEDPFDQLLTDPGTYVLNYDAEIDTIGYFLDSVRLESIGCTDIADPADLYWIFTAPDGTEIVNTSANPLSNSGNTVPFDLGIPGFMLDTGSYELEVWDNDLLFGDDGCADNGSDASVFFVTPPTGGGSFTVTNGGLSATFFVTHLTQTISCSDTFEIFDVPLAADVMFGDSVVSDSLLFFCEGDSIAIAAGTSDSVQWYRNGLIWPGMHDSMIYVSEPGVYGVESINRQTFCRTLGASVSVDTWTVPTPSIAYDGNMTLLVASPEQSLVYVWYNEARDSVGIGAEFSIPYSGGFYAIAVDTTTGCSSLPSATLQTILTSLDEAAFKMAFEAYPNPATDVLRWKLNVGSEPQSLQISLSDMMGRRLKVVPISPKVGDVSGEFAVQDLAAGMYILQVEISGMVFSKTVWKQ
ncbi:T9SS type A sorting domain-containing protein [Pontibacter sp. G13]|uniref:T9SS type A sorting domain-containing protein n=1 Tax=Pontibacter sp. G13 TaxID=3074898 RepID=UPI00288A0403|nr:T9SS type A sorting domain-containing protein [Pontibacter sp. G13]WNJ20781.1 T9SS type A sorting domain-containing protein [Pontibacter sp. G13]